MNRFAAILLLVLIGQAAMCRAQTVFTLHPDQPGARVSPTLYGVFFEEINHSGEGGLYAELVRNRTFKEVNVDGPAGWKFENPLGADASFSVDEDQPLNLANSKSGKITVKTAATGNGSVTLVNEGYWGINARKGALYHFSTYARGSADFHGPITVALQGHDGAVIASAKLETPSADWSRYAVDLTAGVDDPMARLAISTPSTGTVWFNVVSLFPDNTFKHRPNGLRKDLAEMIQAMHPAFMRFPGGCYVEGGDYTANRFNWKKTIGDIALRPGHANATWGYWSTDGLGYHEYLQLCEDLNVAPLYVSNVGMSHRETVTLDRMPDFIQETLDAIEYANGPVSSTYGALRAKNGHPGSFHLKYLEIGNENGLWGNTTHSYNQRYELVYKAVKAAYPEIQCISNTRVDAPADLVDDHVYERPDWFWSHIHQYDQTPRGQKPDVYVGEYADTIDCGKGNLRAALAEAAYMTGFERNSDVVRMSSYAPMFVQTNDRKWNPDAMVFDSSRAFGTPSYWVQVLYAGHRPDEIVPADLTGAPIDTGSKPADEIGLATWSTRAEFKDVVVSVGNSVAYSSNHADGGVKWRNIAGDWAQHGDTISQTADGQDRRQVLELPALASAPNFTITLKARKTAGSEGFLIQFHGIDDQNYSWWNIGGWNNTQTGIEKSVAGVKTLIGNKVDNHIETNRWYNLRLEVTGSRLQGFIDGKRVVDAQDFGSTRFTAIAGKTDDGTVSIKAVNATATACPVQIEIDGGSKLEPVAQVVTLTSSDDLDENTFDDSKKISPRDSTFTGVSDSFSYSFPARSVTIVTLKQRAANR